MRFMRSMGFAAVRLCGCAAAVINFYEATIAGLMSQNLHKKKTSKTPRSCSEIRDSRVSRTS